MQSGAFLNVVFQALDAKNSNADPRLKDERITGSDAKMVWNWFQFEGARA